MGVVNAGRWEMSFLFVQRRKRARFVSRGVFIDAPLGRTW